MGVNQKFKPASSIELMDQVSQVLRYHHYTYRTEETYCRWIKDNFTFCELIHPARQRYENYRIFVDISPNILYYLCMTRLPFVYGYKLFMFFIIA